MSNAPNTRIHCLQHSFSFYEKIMQDCITLDMLKQQMTRLSRYLRYPLFSLFTEMLVARSGHHPLWSRSFRFFLWKSSGPTQTCARDLCGHVHCNWGADWRFYFFCQQGLFKCSYESKLYSWLLMFCVLLNPLPRELSGVGVDNKLNLGMYFYDRDVTLYKFCEGQMTAWANARTTQHYYFRTKNWHYYDDFPKASNIEAVSKMI